MLTFVKRNLAVVIVTSVVLGAGAVAWAQEAPPDPSTGDPAPPAAAAPGEASDEVRPPKHHRGRHQHKAGMGLAGPAIHGDVIIPNGEGGFEEVTFDKGIVRQEGDGYVLERPDGVKVQVKLTDSTKFRGIENASQIRVGERAMVVSEKNGDARSFNQRPPGLSGQERQQGAPERGEMKARRDGRNKPADGSVAPTEEQVPAA